MPLRRDVIQMPNIGEIKRAREIGKSGGNNTSGKYIWSACIDCGKERWVAYNKKRNCPRSQFCHDCGMKALILRKNLGHNRERGRTKTSEGYILVKLYPNDFYFSMTDVRGYVMEHRLIVAENLRRCLQLWEIVHHKNGIKDDNRIENLQLVTDDRHTQITILEFKIERQARRIKELENILTTLNYPACLISKGRKK